jgi:hypothetical protein
MEERLAALVKRTDLNAIHRREAEESCHDMMRQYLREIKLYEATHNIAPSQPAGASHE